MGKKYDMLFNIENGTKGPTLAKYFDIPRTTLNTTFKKR